MKSYRDNKRWTEEELKILGENYFEVPQEEMLKLLPGRGWAAIVNKVYYLQKEIKLIEGKE